MLPIKDWLIVGALAVLVAGFFALVRHERQVQADKDKAAAVKIEGAEQARDKALQDLAALKLAKAGVAYEQAINLPPVDPPVARLCYYVPRSAPSVPAASAGVGGAPTDQAAGVLGGGHSGDLEEGPDIGPELVAVSKDDDAVIQRLLAEIDALRAEMAGAP